MKGDELNMKSTEDLLHQLDGLQGSLEIVQKRVGLEGVQTLKKIINDLEAYVDQTISDLEFVGLTDLAREARGE